jgi:hypothetical protein
MPDYSKTIIYKLICNDENITDFYIGHTTDYLQRKNNHKSHCNNIKSKKHNLKVYKFIRENGNWNNWNMIKFEDYPCNDEKEAKQREDYWVEELKSTLNSIRPSRTKKEYREQNANKIKEYREQNANKNKEYREQNAEKIKEKSKEYYEQNAEKIKEIRKEYYKQNAEKIKEKILCECGCKSTKGDLKKHQKSAKHINLMSNK